jgi:hypothetical protein
MNRFTAARGEGHGGAWPEGRKACLLNRFIAGAKKKREQCFRRRNPAVNAGRKNYRYGFLARSMANLLSVFPAK